MGLMVLVAILGVVDMDAYFESVALGVKVDDCAGSSRLVLLVLPVPGVFSIYFLNE